MNIKAETDFILNKIILNSNVIPTELANSVSYIKLVSTEMERRLAYSFFVYEIKCTDSELAFIKLKYKVFKSDEISEPYWLYPYDIYNILIKHDIILINE